MIVILLFIIVPVFVLGYLGFIPGISSLFGSNKPRDLGIKYTEEDRASARGKTQVTYADLPSETPASSSIQLSGSRPVSFEMSSAEASALMNNRPWRFFPYKDVQVKFNADGSGEISGILVKDKVPCYAEYIGIPKEAVEAVMKALPADPVFYLKMTASLKDNQVETFAPGRFEIGRMALPINTLLASFKPVLKKVYAAAMTDLVNEASKVKDKRSLIISYINSRLSSHPGFFAKNARASENKLIFEGTLPEKEAVVR